MHHPPGADQVARKPFPALHAAVAEHDFAAPEAVRHEREPAVRGGVHVRCGEEKVLVMGRFDPDVERHFGRDREAGIQFDLGGRNLWERLFDADQVVVEVGVPAYIDDHHFEVGVLLGDDERQDLLHEGVVFREEGNHHRYRRGFGEDLRTPGVLVFGYAPVNEQVVI